MIGNSIDKANFPHKLLTNSHVLRLHKALVNKSSANIKFLKTQFLKCVLHYPLTLKSISCMTELVETSRLLHFSTN